MRRVRYSDDALENLGEIFVYVRDISGSGAIGRKKVATIRSRCSQLASLPGTMGRVRPEIGPNIRSAALGDYVIFFRYLEVDIFEVVAIVEGHRDLNAYFGSGV